MKNNITILEWANRIEAYIYNLPYFSNRNEWTKSHCRVVGKVYKEQLWYIDNVLKTFETGQVFFDSDNLYIKYPMGSAKIKLDELEREILLPEIETIVNHYGKMLFNVKNHLIAA